MPRLTRSSPLSGLPWRSAFASASPSATLMSKIAPSGKPSGATSSLDLVTHTGELFTSAGTRSAVPTAARWVAGMSSPPRALCTSVARGDRRGDADQPRELQNPGDVGIGPGENEPALDGAPCVGRATRATRAPSCRRTSPRSGRARRSRTREPSASSRRLCSSGTTAMSTSPTSRTMQVCGASRVRDLERCIRCRTFLRGPCPRARPCEP